MKQYIYTSILFVILAGLFLEKRIERLWFKKFPRGEEYGKSYNYERLDRGILPIPSDWNTNDHDKYTKTWMPTTGTLYRNKKIVAVEKGVIDSEVDYLFKDGEHLEIIYSYENERGEADPWEIYLQTKDNDNLRISKHQMDSILNQWGVSKR